MRDTDMATGIYRRVSSKDQTTASQGADLDAYRESLKSKGEEVKEFEDKFTGRVMSRPAWDRLWKAVEEEKINRIVVWRLDRLGRTCVGLSRLFQELRERKVTLVSLKDGLDLGTAAGRLMAHVLASVAEYELEVKTERQAAGIAAARQAVRDGKRARYGSGRKPGLTIAPVVCKQVLKMKADGQGISDIARVTSLSRPTVRRVLREFRPSDQAAQRGATNSR
jgi:DNA invertase Pin-like site-specific DNA recombinase